MTIYQLLKLVQDGNTAMEMFGETRCQRSIYIDVLESKLGYFDNPTDFEIEVRTEYTPEFATHLLTAELAPIKDDRFPWTNYNAINQETGEVLARVKMYAKN